MANASIAHSTDALRGNPPWSDEYAAVAASLPLLGGYLLPVLAALVGEYCTDEWVVVLTQLNPDCVGEGQMVPLNIYALEPNRLWAELQGGDPDETPTAAAKRRRREAAWWKLVGRSETPAYVDECACLSVGEALLVRVNGYSDDSAPAHSALPLRGDAEMARDGAPWTAGEYAPDASPYVRVHTPTGTHVCYAPAASNVYTEKCWHPTLQKGNLCFALPTPAHAAAFLARPVPASPMYRQLLCKLGAVDGDGLVSLLFVYVGGPGTDHWLFDCGASPAGAWRRAAPSPVGRADRGPRDQLAQTFALPTGGEMALVLGDSYSAVYTPATDSWRAAEWDLPIFSGGVTQATTVGGSVVLLSETSLWIARPDSEDVAAPWEWRELALPLSQHGCAVTSAGAALQPPPGGASAPLQATLTPLPPTVRRGST